MPEGASSRTGVRVPGDWCGGCRQDKPSLQGRVERTSVLRANHRDPGAEIRPPNDLGLVFVSLLLLFWIHFGVITTCQRRRDASLTLSEVLFPEGATRLGRNLLTKLGSSGDPHRGAWPTSSWCLCLDDAREVGDGGSMTRESGLLLRADGHRAPAVPGLWHLLPWATAVWAVGEAAPASSRGHGARGPRPGRPPQTGRPAHA